MSTFDDRVYTPSEAALRLPHRRTPLGRLLDADAVDAMAIARQASRRRDGEVAP